MGCGRKPAAVLVQMLRIMHAHTQLLHAFTVGEDPAKERPRTYLALIHCRSLNHEYVEYCQERFEIGDLVEVGLGANDLPAGKAEGYFKCPLQLLVVYWHCYGHASWLFTSMPCSN
jgi:hypothetical protein